MKRKLFLLAQVFLVSMMTVVNAQSFDAEKTYTIECNNQVGKYMQDNGDGYIVPKEFNDNSYWYLIATGNEGCYYVKNATTNRYMQKTSEYQVSVKTGDDENHIFLTQENTPMFACVTDADGYTDLGNIEDACYQLQKGSPCIDSGDDNYAAISPSDLAGCKRLVGTHIDRGAYEFDEDATSINEELRIKNEELNEGAVYNLAGQRLQKMQKGFNIVDDKKILRK